MTTLGNPHHSLLLGKPHHHLLGNLHQGNPHHSVLLGNPHHLENLHHSLLLGNPRHGLLLGNLPVTDFWRIFITIFPWGIPVTVFSGGIPIILGNHHHGLLLPPFGRWWISFSRPFLIIRLLLPIHNQDHSIFYYYLDVAEAIPQQELFAHHIKHGKACHTLFHTLNEFEKVSDIRPLRGRNWRRILTSMRSMLEIHGFLTWSVIASICCLHVGNLLPKDDQSISQLRNRSPRPVANWLLAYRHLPSLSP